MTYYPTPIERLDREYATPKEIKRIVTSVVNASTYTTPRERAEQALKLQIALDRIVNGLWYVDFETY